MEGGQEARSEDSYSSDVSSSYDISRETKRGIFWNYMAKSLALKLQSNVSAREGEKNGVKLQNVTDFYRVQANGQPELGQGLVEVVYLGDGKDRYLPVNEEIKKMVKTLHRKFNYRLRRQGMGSYKGLEFVVDNSWDDPNKSLKD